MPLTLHQPFYPLIFDDQEIDMGIHDDAFDEAYFNYDGLSSDKAMFDQPQLSPFNSFVDSSSFNPSFDDTTTQQEVPSTVAPSMIWNPAFAASGSGPSYQTPLFNTDGLITTTTYAQQQSQQPFGPPGPIQSLNFSSRTSTIPASTAMPHAPLEDRGGTRTVSRTPSLCGDGPTLIKPEPQSPQSPHLPQSPGFFSHPSYSSSSSSHPTRTTTTSPPTTSTNTSSNSSSSLPSLTRPRGRPRKTSLPVHSSGQGSKSPISPRGSPGAITKTPTTHKDIERKYRQGINNDLDRLRRAIPSLRNLEAPTDPTCQQFPGQGVGEDGVAGLPAAGASTMTKPTKSQILAAAVEYIRRMEMESEGLRREVLVLRGEVAVLKGMGGGMVGGG